MMSYFQDGSRDVPPLTTAFFGCLPSALLQFLIRCTFVLVVKTENCQNYNYSKTTTFV